MLYAGGGGDSKILAGGSVIKGQDKLDIFSVTLPTSYDATNKIQVDLTASFTTAIREVVIARGSWGGVLFEVVESGSDTFANRKFRLLAKRPTASQAVAGTNSTPTFTGDALSTHTHTITQGTPTTDANAVKATGTLALLKTNTGTSQAAGGQSCVVTGVNCNGQNHFPGLNGIVFSSDLLQAPGATKFSAVTAIGNPTASSTSGGTPSGTVSAPTFTGTTQVAAVAEEVAGATNLQTLTGFTSITLLVIGL